MPSASSSASTANLTSSSTGRFYFAFGSNLSPTQMRGRLTSSPTSSVPIAIARLDGWKWLICERGYANIVELPSSENDTTTAVGSADATTVWGVVYNLTPEDEATLDLYEGYDRHRNPSPTPNPNIAQRRRRPFLQGGWDYNKHYIPVTVTKWLVDPAQFGSPSALMTAEKSSLSLSSEITSQITVLVYVDEFRLREGVIQREYVGRMNRAIDEGVALGMPGTWCESVMRRWIRPGVYPADRYVGSSGGYVEGEEELVEVGSEAS